MDTYGLIGNMAIAAGTAIENYIAGQGNGAVMGNSFGNRIQGRDGSDTLYGGAGHDTLAGGGGRELLSGGSGNDLFNGGRFVDTLTGGYGADRFYRNGQNAHGRDTITDFNHAQGDHLLMSGNADWGDFFVVYGHATNSNGRLGNDNVQEVYIVYAPTGQTVSLLVDGAQQNSLYVTSGGDTFDLLA